MSKVSKAPHWKRAKITDCARIVSGATPKTSESRYWDGDISWVTPKDVSDLEGQPFLDSTPRKLTAEGLASCSAEILPPRSVLLSSRAPIGLVAINKIPVATNQGFKSFVPDPALLDAGYLYQWLKANRRTLESLGTGATFKEVSKAVISRIEIPLPPLDEQKRIAAVLDKVDALRRQRQESLQLTEKLLQSVFIHMFGEPGANPNKWNTLPLEELCEKIVDCPHSTPVYSDAITGFYCVRSSDIQNGKLDLASTRHVSESIFMERIARHEPKPGEVIYTREGGRLGFAAQVPQRKRVCLGQRMMLFKAKEKVSTNAFLANLLNSGSFRRKVLNLVGGGAAPRVNIKDLKTIEVYQPPFELQKRFEAFATSLQNEEESLARSADRTRTLFDSLQQRAFRGELDLSRLVLDPAEDTLPTTKPVMPATKTKRPMTAARFIEVPPALEASLQPLDRKVDKGEPIPWSLDYFKYRILATQPAPFRFADLMERAEVVFDEPPLYEQIKDLLYDLLGQDGKAALLRQRFDLQEVNETDYDGRETVSFVGRKEIVFETMP